MRHVRLFVAPWFFRLPPFRRFDGYAAHDTILLREPPGPDAASDDLVTHELCHVWQMQHHPVQDAAVVRVGALRAQSLRARGAPGCGRDARVIRTPRLELVPLTDDEAEAVLAGRREGRAWSPGYPTPGDVETASWPAPADARWRTLQIVERATGLVIGAIGCHAAPEEGIVEVGYGIATETRGRGLATEALAALVAFLEAQPEVRVAPRRHRRRQRAVAARAGAVRVRRGGARRGGHSVASRAPVAIRDRMSAATASR